MVSVLKTKLNKTKSVCIALLAVYGIGFFKSKLICKQLGFLLPLKIKNLSSEQITKLKTLTLNLSFKVVLTNDLKKLIKKNEKKLVQIASYRGIRLNKGLPVRGQRTHSNANTAARFVNRSSEQQKKAIKKKYKKKKKNEKN